MESLSELERDAIAELANVGAGKAAVSLSEITSREVVMSIPEVELLRLNDIHDLLAENNDDHVVVIEETLSGLMSGKAIALFPESKSLAIVKYMLSDNISLREISDLEKEVMLEVGNIILNACVGVFANLLNQEVKTSMPVHHAGESGKLLKILVPDTKADEDQAFLLLRVYFQIEGEEVSGYLMFVLNHGTIQAIKKSVQIFLKDHQALSN